MALIRRAVLINFVLSVMLAGALSAQTGTLFVEGDNVGIGTDTPTARLDVENTTGNADLRFFSVASANIILDRGNSQSFSRFQFRTGGTLRWSFGMINDSSDNLHLGPSIFTTHVFVDRGTGEVGIGTTNPQGKLDVNGAIFQRGGVLHADYVFSPDYQIESIEEHAELMWEKRHLPAMPQATVDENGYEVVEIGAQRRGLVEELEKAHIYIEELNKKLKQKDEAFEGLKDRLSRLEERVLQRNIAASTD